MLSDILLLSVFKYSKVGLINDSFNEYASCLARIESDKQVAMRGRVTCSRIIRMLNLFHNNTGK